MKTLVHTALAAAALAVAAFGAQAQTFPDGVCDWTRPGVGQQPLTGTWLSFGPSPVNLLFDITKKLVSSFM